MPVGESAQFAPVAPVTLVASAEARPSPSSGRPFPWWVYGAVDPAVVVPRAPVVAVAPGGRPRPRRWLLPVSPDAVPGVSVEQSRVLASRLWASPAFWRLSHGASLLRDMLPDVPDDVTTHASLLRWRKRMLHATLARASAEVVRPPKPPAYDPAALAAHMPHVSPPAPPLTGSRLNAQAWATMHCKICERCRGGLVADCYGQRIVDFATTGFYPPLLDWPRPFLPPPREPSAEDAEALAAQLRKELAAGEVVRFPASLGTPRFASPRFVVWKRSFDQASGSFVSKPRVVQDLRVSGVNAVAVKWGMSYDTIDHFIASLSPGSYIWGCDVKAAFKCVSLHPDWLVWAVFRQRDPDTGEDAFWVSLKMVFGLTSAPGCFSLLSGEVVLVLLLVYGINAWCFLDDFRGGAASLALAHRDMALAKALLAYLGLITDDDKDELPAQRARVIGMQVDTVAQTVSLPPDKVRAMRAEIELVLNAESPPSVADLMSLLGRLTYAGYFVLGGRAFLGPLRRLVYAARCAGRRVVPLTPAVRADLRWWADTALLDRNCTRAWLDAAPTLFASFCGDAGDVGCACHTADDVFHHVWSPAERDWPVPARELYWVWQGLRRWGPVWRGSHVVVATDSASNAFALATGSFAIAVSPVVEQMLRDLFDECHRHSVLLTPLWLPRECLRLSDALAACSSSEQARALFVSACAAYTSVRSASERFQASSVAGST